MPRSFIYDDSAVNIEIGYILNLIVLLIVTGSITGAFYLRADDSSQEAMRIGFTDLGSQIARDITNMYLMSPHSSNINMNITRSIPLTIGGKGYSIELKNASHNGLASVVVKEGGFFGTEISTKLNSIDSNVEANGTVYSGSGEININMIENETGVVRVRIK
jgi:hypothetical protein